MRRLVQITLLSLALAAALALPGCCNCPQKTSAIPATATAPLTASTAR